MCLGEYVEKSGFCGMHRIKREMQAPFVFENLNIYTHQGQGADMGEGEKEFLWEKINQEDVV
jgi:hypothetical protein